MLVLPHSTLLLQGAAHCCDHYCELIIDDQEKVLEEKQVMLERVPMELMVLFWEVERDASVHCTTGCTGCN